MAKISTVAIIGRGWYSEITEKYLVTFFPQFVIKKYETKATEEFDVGFICLPPKRHGTGRVDVADIRHLIAKNKDKCIKKHFFIRSPLSVGQTFSLTGRCFLSYFPILHKRESDFEKIAALVSRPRHRSQIVERLNREFFGDVPYEEFEHETLELGALMRMAMNGIQAMGWHVLNEMCQAQGIDYRAAILCTIYAAEKHGEFSIYGAKTHSAYSDWIAALKDLSSHGKRVGVLGRALFDVVDGLNEQYFSDQ